MIRILATLLLLGPIALPQSADAGLRKLLADQTAAWNRRDLVAFMESYWHSPEVTFFSGHTITTGWEATLNRYRDKYQSAGKSMGKLSFSDEKIQMLGPAVALVTARWHLEMADGERLEGLTTLLCRRLDEGWRIVHDHSS